MKRGMKYLHPGILLRAEVIEAHGLNVTEAANLLHITRPALSNILNGKSAISPEMALKIATVFGGKPQFWMSMQNDYDLQEAQKKLNKIRLKPYIGEHIGQN